MGNCTSASAQPLAPAPAPVEPLAAPAQPLPAPAQPLPALPARYWRQGADRLALPVPQPQAAPALPARYWRQGADRLALPVAALSVAEPAPLPVAEPAPLPQAEPAPPDTAVPAPLEPAIPSSTTIRTLIDGNRYTLSMTSKGLRTLRANDLTWSKNGVRNDLPSWPTLNDFLKSLPDSTEVSFDIRLRRVKEGDMWETSVENFRQFVAYYSLTAIHDYVFSESAGGSYVYTTPLRNT